jgi:alpha-beta hydrolase superfamily lysophospholipase
VSRARAHAGFFTIRPVLAALLSGAILLGGCAPRLQEIGPDIAAPMLTEDAIVMPDGTALPLRSWLPDAAPVAVVLALHGFNDYSRAFEMPAGIWARQGIATYAYDQRGFGETDQVGKWPGDDRLIADLAVATALLRARHPGLPFYVLGESMGGAVAMAAIDSADPPEADGAILVSPAVWGRETQGALNAAALWFFAHTMPWAVVTGDGFRVIPTDNRAVLQAMGEDPLVLKKTRVDTLYGLVGLMDRSLAAAERLGSMPTLLLYGAKEDVMPSDAVMEMLQRLPHDPADDRLRVAIYPEGYHMLLRDLAAAAVWQDVAAWIAHHDAPLPSRADVTARRVLNGDEPSLDAVASTDMSSDALATTDRPSDAAIGAVPAE